MEVGWNWWLMVYIGYCIVSFQCTFQLTHVFICIFLYTMHSYGNGLFSGRVTKAMGIAMDPKGEALASLILQSIAYPGYLFTVAFAQRIGMYVCMSCMYVCL